MGEERNKGAVRLVGISGVFVGGTFLVEEGQAATIGRSRSCDISLRVPSEGRDEEELNDAERHLRTVSRRHLTVEVNSSEDIQIADHSSHGSFIDGRRIEEGCTVTNLPESAHELKLGTNEAFRMEWVPAPDKRAALEAAAATEARRSELGSAGEKSQASVPAGEEGDAAAEDDEPVPTQDGQVDGDDAADSEPAADADADADGDPGDTPDETGDDDGEAESAGEDDKSEEDKGDNDGGDDDEKPGS
jgi:hypothetical protein